MAELYLNRREEYEARFERGRLFFLPARSRREPGSDGMTAASWVVVGLSVLGTVAEFWGIVIVAGREAEARAAVSKARDEARRRARQAWRRVLRLLPWRDDRDLKSADHAVGTSLTARYRVRGGSLSERAEQLEKDVGQLQGQLASIESGLPARLEEASRDPAHGLGFLIVGLVALLVANILSVAAA